MPAIEARPAPIAAIVPAGTVLAALPAGAEVRWYRSAAEAASHAASGARLAVLLSDGLDAEGQALVAAAIRAAPGLTVIEVRGARWDGQAAFPLGGACRGVVSGFGLAGLLRALEMISREVQAAS